ncbi:protein furry [Tetranychus urticae]|uniref:Uncharacterized protein n=1 Tax=Tetranychus urticae TaxID=32264 RepID=T1K7Q4_TETUR|nr:protein furry [Tetranychus urticae]
MENDVKMNFLGGEVKDLPWVNKRDRNNLNLTKDGKPGEFIIKTLFNEFVISTEKKIDFVLTNDTLEKPISKSLQKGEDSVFDQLLIALGSVAEHCLPSLLSTLFAWYDRQLIATADYIETKGFKANLSDSQSKGTNKSSSSGCDIYEKSEQLYTLEKRDLCVEFIFCLFLIEVLKQLPLHPGHEDLISHIENLAFKHFKYREGAKNDPNYQNINIVADLYAEVIGVLAQARFHSVRKRFMAELKELRSREPSMVTTQSIINLLMGMKFFRIKMVPIEQFEASFEFMHECAHYFIEVKDKDIKHNLAGLFVDILSPVAATVKNEVNVPCLKNFVEMLYPLTLDLCVKKKHTYALFPLVTCLLCVSQKQFFLKNWHCFLSMCLSHLKNRDSKMSKLAMESLHRLLWVYMIRIKCESNTATQSKLQSIVYSLFPKGSKAVVPRDVNLSFFVKIIQFIAQEKLDFAMKGIVYDLLSVDRPIKVIFAPERMTIGLRAFIVVADSLQQKEGEPPMPRTPGVMPSGNTLRVKRTYLNKMLTERMAKNIGVNDYYPHVLKSLNDILKALDLQFGKPLMLTTVQNINKEPDDMITGERKPKIDLFRACIAAIPRLIPDGMSRTDLIDLLSRLTVHMDEELRVLAWQALQHIINNFPEWRDDVVEGFINFILSEINDTFPQLLDNALRMLLQLLASWKTSIQASGTSKSPDEAELLTCKGQHTILIIHRLEAIGLVMLVSCRQPTRRLAANLLKETRSLLKCFSSVAESEDPVLDVIDRIRPSVLENCLHTIPASERSVITSSSYNVDIQWLADRTGSAWLTVTNENEIEINRSAAEIRADSMIKMNAWSSIITGLMSEVSKVCTSATFFAWSLACQRLNYLTVHIDTTSINDNRASVLLRGASSNVKKSPNERDAYLALWKNYLMFACSIVPSSSSVSSNAKLMSHDLSSSPDSMASERSLDNKSPLSRGISASCLFSQILPHIKNENNEIRNAAIFGLSHINPFAVKELMEELIPYIREAIDRNKENNRKRKLREFLRIQLGILLELLAGRGIFGLNSATLDREADGLNNTFVEYIDGLRLYLENENDKENPNILEIRIKFCGFINNLVKSFPLESRSKLLSRDLRANLFQLFASWSGKYSQCLIDSKTTQNIIGNTSSELEFMALEAMSSVLACGHVFDNSYLLEDSSVYTWLRGILASSDEKVTKLAHETIVLLLEFNPDTGPLLDWLVDACYSQKVSVSDSCFTAIATIFSLRDYPCDHYIAIINVTLMNVGSPRANISEMAFNLLQILDHRFFGSGKKLALNDDFEKPEKNISNFEKILEDDEPEEVSDEEISGVQLRKKDNSKHEFKPFEPLLNSSFPLNQSELSQRMAKLHADLTMPFFSEITFRLQMARPSICRNMLDYLKPWLTDMELVDSYVIPQTSPLLNNYNSNHDCDDHLPKGWGCAEATEMVLNNLFYITVKFGDEYSKEIEKLWFCLCSKFPNNMRIIIRYLFIVTGLSPNELLPFAKRVALYMARVRPERFIDEMMVELQTVEYLNCVIERTETPPFFRITARKENGHSEEGTVTAINFEGSNRISMNLEQGTLHTKRHSTESGAADRIFASVENASSQATENSTGSTVSGGISTNRIDRLSSMTEDPTVISFASVTEESLMLLARVAESEVCQPSSRQPHPLPMPEFGGYYAPLTEFLPDSSQPVVGFHRCNLALILLCDVVSDGIPIDWSPHIPIMLNIIFLGLDHPKILVHEHCKQLLLNLLIVCCVHNDPLTISRIMLNNKTARLKYNLTINPAIPEPIPNFTEPPADRTNNLLTDCCLSQCRLGRKCFDMPSNPSLNDMGKENWSVPSEDVSDNCSNNSSDEQLNSSMNLEMLVKCLIQFLDFKRGSILWNCEDITAKVWSVRSAAQLSYFLEHILLVFKESLVRGHIEERWAEVALQLALSCSSRHYAGRSLQIFRAIKLPINSRMLSDILSRLVETVAEPGEDMQGYVTELMLTLESAVDSLNSERHILSEYIKALFKNRSAHSGPDQGDDRGGSSPTAPPPSSASSQATVTSSSFPNSSYMTAQHLDRLNHADRMNRSISITIPERKSAISMGSPNIEHREMRFRSNTEVDFRMAHRHSADYNFGRSRSAQSLKTGEDQIMSSEDRISLLAQFFWISVAMLETDYEHEFLLALRLMEKILAYFPLERNDTQEKVEKVILQSKWINFPGVHAMLLKGCTSTATYQATIYLLHRLTPFLDLSFVDPSENIDSFPFNVFALLPYMLANYDDPNALCIHASKKFAEWCTTKVETGTQNMENLATVMTLYSKKAFSKESFQWTKCVVKYLFDAYPYNFPSLVTFLVEVLDKGPSSLSSHVLSILHCMLHYMDITTSSSSLNNDLSKIVHKYIEGPQWKDSLKILKLVVARSSTLAAAPSYTSSNIASISLSSSSTISGTTPSYSSIIPADTVSIASGASFADSEFGIRRELPGRTIEFSFDLTQTPIVGRKYIVDEKKNTAKDDEFKQPQTPQQQQSQQTSESEEDNTKEVNKTKASGVDSASTNNPASPRRSLSYNHSFNEGSNWKRPWLSQSRTREKLIGLLRSFGKSVGLPKSPSVIFSQNSDIIERQSSMGSSEEDITNTNNDVSAESKHDDNGNSDQFGLFKDFDFLEYELESQEGESMDNFNWGVRRRSLTNLDDTPENDLRTGSPHQSDIVPSKDEASSDEEGDYVSPTSYDGLNDLSISTLYSNS